MLEIIVRQTPEEHTSGVTAVLAACAFENYFATLSWCDRAKITYIVTAEGDHLVAYKVSGSTRLETALEMLVAQAADDYIRNYIEYHNERKAKTVRLIMDMKKKMDPYLADDAPALNVFGGISAVLHSHGHEAPDIWAKKMADKQAALCVHLHTAAPFIVQQIVDLESEENQSEKED